MKTSLIVALTLVVGLAAFAIPGLHSLPIRQAWCRLANRPYGERRGPCGGVARFKPHSTKTPENSKRPRRSHPLGENCLGYGMRSRQVDIVKAGDVKEDVKGLKDNAKGMMTNPMGQ